MSKTKEKIIMACEELVMKRGRGFYNLSMEEVARKAGVSKRTIYRYFRSKEELIEATVFQVANDIMAKNMEMIACTKNVQERVVHIIKNVAYLANEQFMQELKTHYPAVWLKIDEFRREKYDWFFSILTENQAKLRWRVDPEIFKSSFLAAMSVVMNPSYILQSGKSLEEVGCNFINMFLFGAVEQVED